MAKYEVTQKHTLGHKVGDVIELTENQAKCLVNKVRLIPVIEPVAEPAVEEVSEAEPETEVEVEVEVEAAAEEKPAKKAKKADK